VVVIDGWDKLQDGSKLTQSLVPARMEGSQFWRLLPPKVRAKRKHGGQERRVPAIESVAAFIRRGATTLVVGHPTGGLVAFRQLTISALPQVA